MYVEYLPPADGPQPEAVHLRDYWHAFLRRRWLAFAVFALVVAAAVARVVLVPPLYEATSKILIEREAPDVLAFDKNARVNDAWEDDYQTQHRLLQSRLLARKVVERLR